MTACGESTMWHDLHAVLWPSERRVPIFICGKKLPTVGFCAIWDLLKEQCRTVCYLLENQVLGGVFAIGILFLKKSCRLFVLVESATLCKRFPNCYGRGSESLDPLRAISAAVTQIKKYIKFASGAQPGRHCKQDCSTKIQNPYKTHSFSSL